ncbi:MAG: hypothetical protein VW985_05260 [Gammaproteobacteria bacterium]
MSIIDDALKGVERAQAETTENTAGGRAPMAPGSSRVPIILVICLVLVAAAGVGWWWIGSDAPVRDESLIALQDNPSPAAESSSQPSSALRRADNDSVPSAMDEQVAAITDQAAKVEQPGDMAGADITVGSLTRSNTEPEADLSGVSLLTDGSADERGKTHDSPGFDEQEQLQALTDSQALSVDDALANSSADGGDVSALTASATPPSATPGISEKIAEETVATLTDEGDKQPVDLEQAETAGNRSPEESVAGLTDVEITSPQDDLGAAATNMELMELTSSEEGEGVAGVQTPIPDGVPVEGSTDSVAALTEVDQELPTQAEADREKSDPSSLTPKSQSPTQGLPEADAGQAGETRAVSPESTAPVVAMNVAALTRRALAAESRGDYLAALAALEPVGEDNLEVVLFRARLTARQGNYAESLAFYDSVDELVLDATDSFWLGFTRFNLEQWQPAIAALARASELDPTDAVTALYLGLAQQQAGDYRGSISAFHRARKLRPDMPEIAFNTGISWWALGEKIRAEGAFRHFMRVTDSQRRSYADQRRRVSRFYLGDS